MTGRPMSEIGAEADALTSFPWTWFVSLMAPTMAILVTAFVERLP